MLGLGLIGVCLVLGVLFVAAKILFALVLIPLKIGLGVVKLFLFILVGIPLLIVGCAVIGVALPFLLIGGLALAVLVAPVVLLVKAVS